MADLTVTPIVALDVPSRALALEIVRTLGDRCSFYKVGSELFTATGPDMIRALRDEGRDVFLDLKFHDIPQTVRAAVTSAARLGVRLLTVHASGGRAMLEAAALGAAASATEEGGRCKVLAVSVLTSLDAAALGEAWGRRDLDMETEVLRLAGLARDAGLDGLVCSALEARVVHKEFGSDFELLLPGIRLAGDPAHDQSRVATPSAAAAAGATYIVVGRAVTGAAAPREAMGRVRAELESSRRSEI